MQYRYPLQLLFGMMLLFSGLQAQSSFRMIGYLPYYRFQLADSIDFGKLTHVCLAFAHPDDRGMIRMEGGDVGAVVKRLRKYDLKILVSLAGGGMNKQRSERWVFWMSPAHRHQFIRSIVRYVHQYGLDGVDLDLEWKDVNRYYSDFVLELSAALQREGLIFSAAWPGIHRYQHLRDDAIAAFDFINIMAYDLTGPWDPDRPGQHSSYDFAEDCIQFWRNQGVPSGKINLGLPFYGYNFSDLENVYSVHFKQMVALDPTFANIDRLGEIYYNGRQLIQLKTELARQEAGGIMFWELGQDAFNEHSLLQAAYEAVRGESERERWAKLDRLSPLPQREPVFIQVQEKDRIRYYISVQQGRLLVIQDHPLSGRSRLKLPNSHRFLQVVHVLLAGGTNLSVGKIGG